jgi:urease accessory protein
MIIKEKIGNISSFPANGRQIDYVVLEWYETQKRILHKKTLNGKEIVMKFLKENQQLTQGDIIYEDEDVFVVVDIAVCDVIIINPATMFEMASICYEIGNKHLPLFFHENELLVAQDVPLYRLLLSGGYNIKTGKRKLLHPLKTSVAPHGHESNESLFTKIIKRASPSS